MRMWSLFLIVSVFLIGNTCAETLKNHYNDPFVQVTNAIPNCPQPRGPFMTLQEANAEAHPRAERGTTCFMSGQCKEPNAYRYDATIADAAKKTVNAALKTRPTLARSSVWLTVQRRFVFVHGCVNDAKQVAQWEALIKSVPDVQYVGADFVVGRITPGVRAPYPTMR
jgi:hypothetical protein